MSDLSFEQRANLIKNDETKMDRLLSLVLKMNHQINFLIETRFKSELSILSKLEDLETNILEIRNRINENLINIDERIKNLQNEILILKLQNSVHLCNILAILNKRLDNRINTSNASTSK